MTTNFKPFFWKGKNFGEYYSSPYFNVFFFNTHFKPSLWTHISKTHACALNQVHGNLSLKAKFKTQSTADGHFTQDRSLALSIRTADCVPVLVYSHNTIFALHCGWRSLAKNIIGKCFQNISLSMSQVFIGPHIRPASYEVSEDVVSHFKATRLKDSLPVFDLLPNAPRPFLCLENIIKNQFIELGCSLNQIHSSQINTYSHPDYSSFRKTQTSRRQWSFITF